MKILAVNKFFYKRGGSETCYFNENELFKKNNHEIIPFSMKDVRNYECSYSRYFVNNIDYEDQGLIKKVNNALKIIYSYEAKKKVELLIKDTLPDIAHLHIFQHQMSPSIIPAIKKYNIPIVNTVHDFKVICPSYKMLSNDGLCQACKGERYYKCFVNKCVKGSRIASTLNTLEAYLHSFLRSYMYIDKFLCPSLFIKNKLAEFGIPAHKAIYLPNFINAEDFTQSYIHEDYFLYIGRLSSEKGLITLIKAMKHVKSSTLLIVGSGPIESSLKELTEKEEIPNIRFLGYKSGEELKKLISNCMFSVLPSEWFENAPMSILESMAYGKATVGSNIGGIPELIDNNGTGLVFEPGNALELADKLNFMIEKQYITTDMGKNARRKVEEKYNAGVHYERLFNIYSELLKV